MSKSWPSQLRHGRDMWCFLLSHTPPSPIACWRLKLPLLLNMHFSNQYPMCIILPTKEGFRRSCLKRAKM
jgi:hypothetical protein